MGETPPHGESLAPSLLQRLRARRPFRPGRLRVAGAALLAALALIAAVAGWLGRQARREAVALGDRVEAASAAREADRVGATLFADATAAQELAALAAHLPPETRLALAGRDANGALTIAIDSADPDALRQRLRVDPWFTAFRERGQATSEEGAIRVTFERVP